MEQKGKKMCKSHKKILLPKCHSYSKNCAPTENTALFLFNINNAKPRDINSKVTQLPKGVDQISPLDRISTTEHNDVHH